jgi:tetratricopeptide (TPR) repeat protein
MVAYLFYLGRMWEREKWRAIFLFVAAVVLGFSIYLYIPIGSMQDPILNWGNPVDLESFIRHISAWQYRVWMFSGGTDLIQKLGGYFLLLSDQFNPLYLFLLLPGGFFLFRHQRSLLIVLLILFLSNLFYSLNYDIPDIDPYFIPSFFVVVVLIAIGIYQVAEWIALKKSALVIPFVAASFLLPLSTLRFNYQVCDRSRDYMAYEFASNFLSTISKDAVVLTRTWDLYAPVMYLQLIEERRQDITMIDYELMRRSWYVRDLMEDSPDLFLPAREKVEVFLELVADFEAGEPYNSRQLENAFYNMLNAILTTNYPEKPSYVDFDDNPNIAPALKKNPRGLIFQLLDEYDGVSYDRIQFLLNSTLDLTIYRDERAQWIRSLYPWYAVKEGIALREIERYAEAVKSLEEALFFDPNNTTVLHLLGDSYFQLSSLERAMGCYRRIISITPGDLKARQRLEQLDRAVQGDF